MTSESGSRRQCDRGWSGWFGRRLVPRQRHRRVAGGATKGSNPRPPTGKLFPAATAPGDPRFPAPRRGPSAWAGGGGRWGGGGGSLGPGGGKRAGGGVGVRICRGGGAARGPPVVFESMKYMPLGKAPRTVVIPRRSVVAREPM